MFVVRENNEEVEIIEDDFERKKEMISLEIEEELPTKVCEVIELLLNELKVVECFMPLELGGVDVILGMKWLYSLGEIEMDSKNLTMVFYHENIKVVIRGDPNLTKARKNYLQRREIEQHIHLKKGTDPVNVRLYRFAYQQKAEMEKLVDEMLILGYLPKYQSIFKSSAVSKKEKWSLKSGTISSMKDLIGAHFGGLENIAFETINFINVSEAKIQAKENLCGFIPATIEISDEREGNIFLNFGVISLFNPPSKVLGDLFTHNFSNSLDIVRLSQVMKDEGLRKVHLAPKFDYLLPSNSIPSMQRNPYELSERLFKHLRQRPRPFLRNSCSFKAQEKHFQGHQSLKSSFTEVNPLEVSSALVQATGYNNKLEEDGSLEDQDPDVESVPSVSSEELEEFKAGEEVEDSEILENIISDVRGLFVEESVQGS
ncbi:DNA/RNA polymerases superfamily protein [Cucumis melo var. makuwa]|uniref:DNA/RNA polymerases superfamily protein n=1 Tax=Cucumis melo var. makuwa TaxID=1194695 RepID=A0A5D3CZ35_CUCMM|nr:DNA/RNA polymerases superfamily protein [Cucumis melo var. makuwa]